MYLACLTPAMAIPPNRAPASSTPHILSTPGGITSMESNFVCGTPYSQTFDGFTFSTQGLHKPYPAWLRRPGSSQSSCWDRDRLCHFQHLPLGTLSLHPSANKNSSFEGQNKTCLLHKAFPDHSSPLGPPSSVPQTGLTWTTHADFEHTIVL